MTGTNLELVIVNSKLSVMSSVECLSSNTHTELYITFIVRTNAFLALPIPSSPFCRRLAFIERLPHFIRRRRAREIGLGRKCVVEGELGLDDLKEIADAVSGQR